MNVWHTRAMVMTVSLLSGALMYSMAHAQTNLPVSCNGFSGAWWQCHDGTEKKDTGSACVPSEKWSLEARNFCKDHCKETAGVRRCGVNSFSAGTACTMSECKATAVVCPSAEEQIKHCGGRSFITVEEKGCKKVKCAEPPSVRCPLTDEDVRRKVASCAERGGKPETMSNENKSCIVSVTCTGGGQTGTLDGPTISEIIGCKKQKIDGCHVIWCDDGFKTRVCPDEKKKEPVTPSFSGTCAEHERALWDIKGSLKGGSGNEFERKLKDAQKKLEECRRNNASIRPSAAPAGPTAADVNCVYKIEGNCKFKVCGETVVAKTCEERKP